MKLTLTHYGETVSIEKDHDDVDLDGVLEMVEDLLRGAGFQVDHGTLTVRETDDE